MFWIPHTLNFQNQVSQLGKGKFLVFYIPTAPPNDKPQMNVTEGVDEAPNIVHSEGEFEVARDNVLIDMDDD